jgi:hypothetical protein
MAISVMAISVMTVCIRVSVMAISVMATSVMAVQLVSSTRASRAKRASPAWDITDKVITDIVIGLGPGWPWTSCWGSRKMVIE